MWRWHWLALALAAAAAGTQYYNTTNTQKKQDNQLADNIRAQSKHQQEADAKVNTEVQSMQGSNSEASRTTALQNYMTTLAQGKKGTMAGLDANGIGGSAFAAGNAQAQQRVGDRTQETAGLMARIDAPTMQRQQEGFGFGSR